MWYKIVGLRYAIAAKAWRQFLTTTVRMNEHEACSTAVGSLNLNTEVLDLLLGRSLYSCEYVVILKSWVTLQPGVVESLRSLRKLGEA